MNTANTTTQKLSLRKNDQVQVISGREKGKTGKVLKVDSATLRITVEKVNLVKRHVKPSQQHPQGGIIEKELPLHYSNVLLFCSKCNKGSRIGFKQVEQAAKGKKKGSAAGTKSVKVRVCRRCDQTIDTTA